MSTRIYSLARVARLAVLVFMLEWTSCRSQQTIRVLNYAQAKKAGAEYLRRYNPRKKHPYWSARLVGPPPASIHLRRTDTTQAAIVLGHVAVLLEDGTLVPQPGAIVVVDQKNPSFADSGGNYARELPAGQHPMRLGWVGLLWSEVPLLRVERGDSIQLNFQLIPDPRPTIN